MSTLVVRPALPQDEVFLYDLYSAVRAPEFELAPIPATQKELLVRMQFRAQLSAYTEMYPNSCYHLVLLDSKPVGRLWVAPGNGELQLVDIAIDPKLHAKESELCWSSGYNRKLGKPRCPSAAAYSASILALFDSICVWAFPSLAKMKPTTTWNGGPYHCCRYAPRA